MIIPFETRREKRRRRRKRRRREGESSSTKKKDKTSLVSLVYNCSEGVLGQNFFSIKEEEKREEENFTKLIKVFRVSLIIFFTRVRAALGPVQLF